MDRRGAQFNSLSILKHTFLLSLFCSPMAQAELSLNALAGFADYTTTMRGDAIFDYGAARNYFQYPGDVNTTDFAGGATVRYMYAYSPCISLGAEAGYVYINENETRLRADELNPSPVDVENFTTKSNGVVLLNLVGRFNVAPMTRLSLFAGPAWLNTEYIADDFADNISRSASNRFTITADAGAEVVWNFFEGCDDWSLGLRCDYIFNTKNRDVATTGANGEALLVNNTAKSRATIVSATVSYMIPGT